MKLLLAATAALILSVMLGCASIGVPTPSTFNEKLAVGVASVTSVRTSATTLLQAGKITPADAQNIQTQADTAREGLNVARGLSGTDLTGAGNKLTAATAVLTALQTYLLTKQGATP